MLRGHVVRCALDHEDRPRSVVDEVDTERDHDRCTGQPSRLDPGMDRPSLPAVIGLVRHRGNHEAGVRSKA